MQKTYKDQDVIWRHYVKFRCNANADFIACEGAKA
jgi:hypothetical protein